MSEPDLNKWNFLIGTWKGVSDNQSQDEGNIITNAKFEFSPSDSFIHGIFESNNEEGLVNRGDYYLYVNPYDKNYLRKVIFSYGFVNNETSYYFDNSIIKFNTIVEPSPKQFEGITWKSFMKKNSEVEIEFGLENSTDGTNFKLYAKTKLYKQK